jgi:hypothetical protein
VVARAADLTLDHLRVEHARHGRLADAEGCICRGLDLGADEATERVLDGVERLIREAGRDLRDLRRRRTDDRRGALERVFLREGVEFVARLVADQRRREHVGHRRFVSVPGRVAGRRRRLVDVGGAEVHGDGVAVPVGHRDRLGALAGLLLDLPGLRADADRRAHRARHHLPGLVGGEVGEEAVVVLLDRLPLGNLIAGEVVDEAVVDVEIDILLRALVAIANDVFLTHDGLPSGTAPPPRAAMAGRVVRTRCC